MKYSKTRNIVFVGVLIAVMLGLSLIFTIHIEPTTTAYAQSGAKIASVSDPSTIDTSIFTFTLTSQSECSVRVADKTVKKAIIPTTAIVNGAEYPVTSIASNGFANSTNLEKVWLPSSIKEIGSGAFINCGKLKYITLSNVETIGTNAFALTNLEYLILPKTVRSVAGTILRNCSTPVYIKSSEEEVSNFNWNNEWNSYNDNTVEYNSNFVPPIQYEYVNNVAPINRTLHSNVMNDTTEGYVVSSFQPFVIDNNDVYIPAVYEGKPVIGIEDGAFWFNTCNSITIGYAEIPIRIGGFSFFYYGGKSITINRDLYFMDKDGLSSESVFAGTEAKTIILPNTITELGKNAFQGSSTLKDIHFIKPKVMMQQEEINLPNSMASTQVVSLPNTLTALGEEAFTGTKNILELRIPKSVVSAGKNIFVDWDNPQQIYIDYDQESDLGANWDPLWNSSCNKSIINYAKPQIFGITYILNGGSHSGNPSSYSPKETVIFKDAERTGYIFDGWYNETDQRVYEIKLGTVGSITLKAKWIPITYTITYLPNKPNNASSDITGATSMSNHVYDLPGNLTPNGFNLQGWTFIGWIDNEGKTYNDGAYVYNWCNDADKDLNIELNAQWVANNYTITYLENRPGLADESVVGTMDKSSHTYDTPSVLNKNVYTLIGWTFVGWKDTENNVYQDGAIIKTGTKGNSLALLAQWEHDVYNIEYKNNKPQKASNLVVGSMENDSFFYETERNLRTNNFSLKGWIFQGWNTAKDGSGTSYLDSQNVSKLLMDIVLYAQWKPITYYITYYSNGGTGSMERSVHQYDDYDGKLSPSEFYLKGHHVYKWTTNKDGSGQAYLANQNINNLTYENNRNIDLYAQWDANVYYVYYDGNGGTGSMPVTEHVYNQPQTFRENQFTKEGYVFAGWSLTKNGDPIVIIHEEGKPKIYNLVESGAVTVYACWKEFSYTIKFTSHYEGYAYPLYPIEQVLVKYNEVITRTAEERRTKPGETGMFTKAIVFSHWLVKTDAGESWTVTSTTISGKNFTNVYGILVTITAVYVDPPEDNCVAEGTMITLADGSQKAVEKLTGNELLLVWNLKIGKFDTAPILFIDSDARKEYEVINLYFSDGTMVRVISEHAFWDVDLNQYVFLRNDAAKYIGHWFNKQTTDANGNMIWTNVQLSNVVVQQEYTTAWSPVTYGHLCYYVNGMLSMPGATEGLINIFDVDPNTMKIDETAYEKDIEKYGLFTYEEFIEIIEIPEEMFTAFNGQYLKVAIGKGLTTIDELIVLINRYL